MLRQSLVRVAIENEQRCVTGVINSLQQPVFTVSIRSIDNPLAHWAYFHNFYGLSQENNVSSTLRERWIV